MAIFENSDIRSTSVPISKDSLDVHIEPCMVEHLDILCSNLSF